MKPTVASRDAESESESESPGVGATSHESESGSESIKLPRLRLRNVLFDSVIQFAYAWENLHAHFRNNLADVVLKFSRYTHIRVNWGWGLRSHYLQGSIQGSQTQPYPAPQSVRKWHKMSIFLDITRKQISFCFEKDWSLLLVRT